MSFDEFQKKFQINELVLLSGEYWSLSVRPGQLTLGSMVLATKLPIQSFINMPKESGSELLELTALSEKLAKETFGAIRINAVCLMMNDPYIHYHILPRYDREINFNDQKWIDNFWPGAPVFTPCETDSQVLKQIQQKYKVHTSFSQVQ